MSALAAFLVYTQALGALGGALTAVWGEIVYFKAVQDDTVTRAERRHLHLIAASLRYGMFLMLLASFGLVVLAYRSGDALQPALTASYWMFVLLALVIIYVAKRMSEGKVAHAQGAAVVFVTWWFLAFLSFGFIPALPFVSLIGVYLVASIVLFGVLQYVRTFFIR